MATSEAEARVSTYIKKVDELYTLKENYSVPAVQRNSQVAAMIEQLHGQLKTSVEQEQSVKQKAFLVYLQGKVLNAVQNYDKEAEALLSKAVKLDPSLVDAWNSLGECYWKKADLEAARNCFKGALDQAKGSNKDSLRCLSMVLRQVSADPAERKTNIAESVKLAKDAVALDVTDGQSWYILGNALVANFFSNTFAADDMVRALKAYQQAEHNKINNPDLHFNRSEIYKYQEEYQLALQGYAKAAELDPTWPAPVNELQRVSAFIAAITEQLGNKKGVMKPKRLASLADSIPASVTAENRAVVPFAALKAGVNSGKIIFGKVVHSVTSKGFIPLTVVLVDRNQDLLAVSLYNFGTDVVNIGDLVKIPDPYVKVIATQFEGKAVVREGLKAKESEATYPCVQVMFPSLSVNDKVPDSSVFQSTALKLDKTVDETGASSTAAAKPAKR
eukprot:TRINITY_DN30910_c0_g1_i1.p1 TRINITY_DN30910_c0_g1~~TRINITY_DN30910_c0_g1_i1.p1  ORF type:complete len:446 (+),score=131.98 TRINITY_DN30910_c0_g1_i1:109-1446(+)